MRKTKIKQWIGSTRPFIPLSSNHVHHVGIPMWSQWVHAVCDSSDPVTFIVWRPDWVLGSTCDIYAAVSTRLSDPFDRQRFTVTTLVCNIIQV